ncbi:translation initiation factor IF-3 [Entomortierella parvispora]|uniref:Translation initiation factor IF-3 n=1 Tax=Entomortierella parvispora TaxID=205924 RepID=A0A9P3LSB5_9FUNG|nr:translation initiation factor IF-3 [Entomortierella parvispora]
MIPVCRPGSVLLKTSYNQVVRASYTTRSNGAAFLSTLDFLAPAPSQPRGVQGTQVEKSAVRPSNTNASSKREYFKNSPSARNGASSSTASILEGLELPLFGTNATTQGNNTRRSGTSGADFLDRVMNTPSLPNTKNAARGINPGRGSSNTNSGGARPPRNDLGSKSRPELDRPRRDEEIESQWIQYVTEDGQMGGQKTLSSVLRTFDRSKYFLIEVDSSANPPICKLFSKKEMFDKAKALKQAKKASTTTTKELQLNWGTDTHDLNHKLTKCRGFLEKGYRLEIQVNGRKGKSTTAEEREQVMARIKQEFEPVSKYVKNPEWVKATTVTMLLQGIAPKADKNSKKEKEP